MAEDMKVIEIDEEALEDLDASGGATVTLDGVQYKVITGITKKCGSFVKGPNNYKALAIKGTCAQCKYMLCKSGWQVCSYSAIR